MSLFPADASTVGVDSGMVGWEALPRPGEWATGTGGSMAGAEV
ncbi:hypothetical protein [Acrocarpospora sp. B8E8]